MDAQLFGTLLLVYAKLSLGAFLVLMFLINIGRRIRARRAARAVFLMESYTQRKFLKKDGRLVMQYLGEAGGTTTVVCNEDGSFDFYVNHPTYGRRALICLPAEAATHQLIQDFRS